MLHLTTGNSHDAEELTQETFLRALDRWESYRPGTNLRAWLLRIATNAWLDVRRKRLRARSVPLDDDLPGDAAHPGHRLETAEQAERLLLRDPERIRQLAALLEKAPDASRKEIERALGLHRDRIQRPPKPPRPARNRGNREGTRP